MAEDKFKVSPVKHYNAAQYPGVHSSVQASEEPDFDFWKFLFCLVLVMGLSLGLMGCFSQYEIDQCPDDSTAVNGKCVGPDESCDPGLLRCDTGALMVCNEDGEGWTGQNCDAYCQEMYGTNAYSTGCEAEAADPCQCQYDITPGVMAECTPGDFMCDQDESQVQICQDNAWEWTTVNCDDYCREVHGPDYYSMGCDNADPEPCQCEYGMIDGMMAECSPGEIQCQDDDTVKICEDSWSFTTYDCQDWCEATYGAESSAGDCDATEVENPCNCEYGIVDGEPQP